MRGHDRGRSAGSPTTPGELQQRAHGQADDVEVVALDPAHQRRAAALDRVAPRPPLPLAGGQIPAQQPRRRAGGTRPWSPPPPYRTRPRAIRQTPLRTRRVAAAQRGQHLRRMGRVARACRRSSRPSATIVSTPSTGGPSGPRRRRPRPPCDRRSRARPRRGGPLLELLAPRARGPRRHPDLVQDARRCGEREARISLAAGRSGGSSGKNSPTSRAADSGASEPWTMFWPTASA